jgi:hypothetical protein
MKLELSEGGPGDPAVMWVVATMRGEIDARGAYQDPANISRKRSPRWSGTR